MCIEKEDPHGRMNIETGGRGARAQTRSTRKTRRRLACALVDETGLDFVEKRA